MPVGYWGNPDDVAWSQIVHVADSNQDILNKYVDDSIWMGSVVDFRIAQDSTVLIVFHNEDYGWKIVTTDIQVQF